MNDRSHPEFQYLDLLSQIMKSGDRRIDRTGVGTLSMFGAMMRFDLSDGSFPILTTKKVFWKTAVKEMLWFLTGGTNIRELLQQNVKIWTDWPLDKYRKATGENITQDVFEERILSDAEFAAKWGDLGPVYGKQWRRWAGANGQEYDQVSDVIDALKNNPSSRRMLFHAWNVPELGDMALHPCHLVYQFHVSGLDSDPESESGSGRRPRCNILIYQRSCDALIGLPFNLVGGAALLAMVARQAGLDVGELVWMGGDVHLYLNHLDQAKEQISRIPRPLPKMEILNRNQSLDDYQIDDFTIENYDPHPVIKAEVAV